MVHGAVPLHKNGMQGRLGRLVTGLVTLLICRHPLGRLGRPEEAAARICVLLSDEASFMTGGYYLVHGGYTPV